MISDADAVLKTLRIRRGPFQSGRRTDRTFGPHVRSRTCKY